MMGRRPTPTTLKEMAGNPGKRALNKKEPKPKASIPKMPDWLSPVAVVEWNRITKILYKLGLITDADMGPLAAYCQAYAEMNDATRVLDREGREVREPVFDKHGEQMTDADGNPIVKVKSHPAVARQNQAFGQVKRFLVEFGLSPSSRSGLKVITDEGKETDPWDEVDRLRKGN